MNYADIMFPDKERLYLCFHRGNGPLDFFGNAIKAVTRGEFTHVEIRFPDGMCFSSSLPEGGVRFKRIGFSHPEKWAIVVVPDADIDSVRAKANSIKGAGYDVKGLFTWFLLPMHKQNDKRWWCSEACAWALGWRYFRIHPSRMYQMAIDKLHRAIKDAQ